jgi:hypothetical protein
MLRRSFAKVYAPARPNIRDAFTVQHTDGTEHRSTESCEICKRLAATNSAPRFTTALNQSDQCQTFDSSTGTAEGR